MPTFGKRRHNHRVPKRFGRLLRTKQGNIALTERKKNRRQRVEGRKFAWVDLKQADMRHCLGNGLRLNSFLPAFLLHTDVSDHSLISTKTILLLCFSQNGYGQRLDFVCRFLWPKSPRVAQRDVHFDGMAPQARSMLQLFLTRDQKYLCLIETDEP